MNQLYAYAKTSRLMRICAFVLVVCMVFALIPGTFSSVHAETAVTSENLAPSANLKTEDGMKVDRLNTLNDDKEDTAIWRYLTTLGMTYEPENDYYTFTWDTPVTITQVAIVVQKAKQQAPTAWSVEISKDGISNWKRVAEVSNVEWTTDNNVNSNAKESKEIDFAMQKDVKGLRIQVKKVNCAWKNGYAINDIRIFGADALAKEGYVLDWNDEFSQTELDTDKWLSEYLPHNTASVEGAKTKYIMENGVLKLRIDEDSVDYYTGQADREDGGFMVSSIQTYEKNGLHMNDNKREVEPFNGYVTQYGYFELRCKIPSDEGGGVAAWWLVGTEYDAKKNGLDSKQNGEIDIMETFFKKPNEFFPKVHMWDDPDLQEWETQAVTLEGNYTDEFHTYAMDWRPEYIAFYVDGKEVARTNQSPQYEMCMFLSLYTSKNPDYWGGGAASDVYPKDWEIDYLRVYKDANGYPNGTTKPPEREPSGLPLVESQLYTGNGNPTDELGITDLARKAMLTSTAQHASDSHLQHINSEGYNPKGGYQSADNPTFPAEYTFTWDLPQNVDTLNLYSYYANSQAPTEVELQIKKANGNWRKVAEYEIEWKMYTGTPEYAKLKIPQGTGISGLKFIVKDANLSWSHFVIQKIHIYQEFENYALKVPDKDRITNLTLAEIDNIEYINDGKYGASAWRKMKDYSAQIQDSYGYVWDTPIAVNRVTMTVRQGINQAPTAWRVEVSRDKGSTWTQVASISDVKWTTSTQDKTIDESKDLDFALQEGINGLRVCVVAANLSPGWGGYGIDEIEVYHVRTDQTELSVNGYSAALDGSIDMNFFLGLQLTEVEKASDATYACFSISGEADQRVVFHTLPAEANTINGYKFTCKVPAKKMSDTIVVRFYVEGKLCQGVFEYSVAEYAKTIIQDTGNNYTDQEKQMAVAMLHYGAYSQQYFSYHTDKPANDGIGQLNIGNINIQQFAGLILNNAKSLTGVGQINGSKLILESVTTLMLYVQPESGYTVRNLTFTRTDGGRNERLETSATVVNGANCICIPVVNIAAHELSDTVEITVSDSSGITLGVLKYSTLTYGYNVLKSGSYNDALVNLVKVLYHYNQMAIACKTR